MTKLCSVCGTENRDEAQFCRACGTAFAAAPAAGSGAAASTGNVCAECGFQNKPGIRYCANCGMSLVAPSADAGAAEAAPESSDYAGLGPPPISYPSFATVAPYPPAPTDHSALFDDRPPADIPDPDAEIALRQQHAQELPDETTVSFENPAAPNRTPLIVGGVVAALAAAGVAAWLFMSKSAPSPPRPAAASAPVVAAPAVVPAPAPAPSPIIIEEASPPSATAAASAAPSPTPAPAATTGSLGTPPAAAPPLPQLGDPAVESAEAEARRVAAEKKREKAARDKAEREAKARPASAPAVATTPTAAQRAEQEAQARKRAEDAQRARASTAPAPSPAPVAAQARGVREICAGRGVIAEAVCQSRQCGLAEHANEAICRQLREQDERRRNYQN